MNAHSMTTYLSLLYATIKAMNGVNMQWIIISKSESISYTACSNNNYSGGYTGLALSMHLSNQKVLPAASVAVPSTRSNSAEA